MDSNFGHYEFYGLRIDGKHVVVWDFDWNESVLGFTLLSLQKRKNEVIVFTDSKAVNNIFWFVPQFAPNCKMLLCVF